MALMSLRYIGPVDSEDGLLLFGDAATLRQWRGSDNEPAEIYRAETAIAARHPGLSVSVGQAAAVLWDIAGPGTVDVFVHREDESLRLVRSWLEGDSVSDSDELTIVTALASVPSTASLPFAEVVVDCGTLALFWPAEEGACIRRAPGGAFTIDSEQTMTESSAMVFPVASGRYQCVHDEVASKGAEARRCRLSRRIHDDTFPS